MHLILHNLQNVFIFYILCNSHKNLTNRDSFSLHRQQILVSEWLKASPTPPPVIKNLVWISSLSAPSLALSPLLLTVLEHTSRTNYSLQHNESIHRVDPSPGAGEFKD